MSEQINFKIITPERIVLEDQVDKVVATAVDGEFCVLPGHEPLVTALAIDIVRFHDGNEERTASIIGGICEVQNNEVTILSDRAELDVEIDETRAHHAREVAQAEATQKTDQLDVYTTQLAIARAMARLKALEYSQRRRRASHSRSPDLNQ
jgi:F-type H+-transporting ATPase subunit epsilon